MCASVFYLRPRTPAEEAMLRSRAQVNNGALQDLPGGPGYAPAWVRNEGASSMRAKWISSLREYGFDLGW